MVGFDSERKGYLEERTLLIDAEREASRNFDRYILTLSAGALALSLAFVRELAPTPHSGSTILLAGVWLAFGLALIITLLSFLVSQTALRRQRDLLDRNYKGTQNDEGTAIPKETRSKKDLICASFTTR